MAETRESRLRRQYADTRIREWESGLEAKVRFEALFQPVALPVRRVQACAKVLAMVEGTRLVKRSL